MRIFTGRILDLKAVNFLMRTTKTGKRTPTLDKSLDGKRTPTLVKPWRDTPDWNMEVCMYIGLIQLLVNILYLMEMNTKYNIILV